jgi:hypothetical protein
MPVTTDTTPPPSLADLRRAYYGGGTEAEYEALLAASEMGRTASDVIAPLYQWYSSTWSQVIANATWTPIDWTHPYTDLGGLHEGFTAATTIAAGSNNAALPQGTINVASTTGFQAASAAIPQFASIAFADTKRHVFQYTGMTSTSFTGCTLGSGTMLTGQAVAQANCRIQTGPFFHMMIAECAFASNATGGRGIRFRDYGPTSSPFFFVGGQTGPVATIAAQMHVQASMQTVGNVDGTGANIIEVYQSSGGALDMIQEGISSPSLMGVPLGYRLH